MKNFVIIVGGGYGSRMNSAMPKQFLPLGGIPILMHSLAAFEKSTTQPTIILVLHPQYVDAWQTLCSEYAFSVPHQIVYGGTTRFHSVQNGLKYIQEHYQPIDQIQIAVHDGVRPLISTKLIDDGFREVQQKKALVPAIPSKESVRIFHGNHAVAVDRDTVFLVQTPQFFEGKALFQAYEQAFTNLFTDDASVVEQAGFPIHLIKGENKNIKITFPEDLYLAESLLRQQGL